MTLDRCLRIAYPQGMKIDPKRVADKMRRVRSNQPQMTFDEGQAQINQHQRQPASSSTPSKGKPLASTSERKVVAAS